MVNPLNRPNVYPDSHAGQLFDPTAPPAQPEGSTDGLITDLQRRALTASTRIVPTEVQLPDAPPLSDETKALEAKVAQLSKTSVAAEAVPEPPASASAQTMGLVERANLQRIVTKAKTDAEDTAKQAERTDPWEDLGGAVGTARRQGYVEVPGEIRQSRRTVKGRTMTTFSLGDRRINTYLSEDGDNSGDIALIEQTLRRGGGSLIRRRSRR